MEGFNVIDTAIRSGIFQTFTRLLEGSPLEQKLRSQHAFTLFAPVDIAFAYLSPEMFNQLLLAENQGVLAKVLGFHAVPLRIMSHELNSIEKAETVYGSESNISLSFLVRLEADLGEQSCSTRIANSPNTHTVGIKIKTDRNLFAETRNGRSRPDC